MTSEQFCYWLNGYSELTGNTPPTSEQWQMIREHLMTVFLKVTPPLTPTQPPPAVPYTPLPNINPSIQPVPLTPINPWQTERTRYWWNEPQTTCSASGITATVTC